MIHNNVIIGKDSYLFLHEGAHNETSFFNGTRTPTVSSILNFKKNIKNRKKYCESKKISYLHVVFPSKHVIYQENLPKEILALGNRSKGLYYRSYSGEKCVLYPDQELRDTNNLHSYGIQDTHLSHQGYLVVLQKILTGLNINLGKSIEKYFKKEIISGNGDLARMLGIEYINELTYKPKFHYHNYDNINHLAGNSYHTIITRNRFSLKNKRLLIFGDSFFHHLIPFLSLIFREIFFIRSEHIDINITEMFTPDYLLTGNAERYLASVNPDSEAESILLSIIASKKWQSYEEHETALKSSLSYKNNNHAYKKWSAIQDILHPSKNILLHINNQLKIIDGKFCSIGNDPQIELQTDEIESLKKITFNISLIYLEREANLQIFYKLKNRRFFSEEHSISKKISLGVNSISIEFDQQDITYIRIDPLDCRGVFDIQRMTVT